MSDPQTFKQQLLASAANGLAMGIGVGLVALAFALVAMIATGKCQP